LLTILNLITITIVAKAVNITCTYFVKMYFVCIIVIDIIILFYLFIIIISFYCIIIIIIVIIDIIVIIVIIVIIIIIVIIVIIVIITIITIIIIIYLKIINTVCICSFNHKQNEYAAFYRTNSIQNTFESLFVSLQRRSCVNDCSICF